MMAKGIGLTDDLQAYLVDHGTPPDAVLKRLTARTQEATGMFAGMQIAPEQGAFMTWLARLMGARHALEIGTFTGYSAICIARGLPEDGKLLCLDFSEEWTAIAQEAWAETGLDDRIELRLGPAEETLSTIAPEGQFDLAFIDADKASYETYVNLVHARLRQGGVVLVDNVLARGAVVNDELQDEKTRVIRSFNDARSVDERWDRVMLPISDGLMLLRKR
jgi:caffeoyl-CoA O-methyltransferase